MRLRRVMAIARKETLQVMRDPRSLMIALLLPLMQMFMLGYGVNLDVKHLPLCVVDQERNPQSRDLLSRFSASRYFKMRAATTTLAEATRQIDSGSCQLAVVIPSGFSRQLVDRGSATVQVLVDGTDSNTATIAAGYAGAVIAGFSSMVQLEAIQRRGGQIQTLTPVGVQARVWFNEELGEQLLHYPRRSGHGNGHRRRPADIADHRREWERGTMELLISTPVTPWN